jgi:TRAP-type C4-dicarboxylate transport system substrate-binding protein
MARQAARGRLDIGVFSNNAASLLVPEMQLLQLPFLWDSDAQMDCVFDTKINGLIEEMMMAKGLVPLAYVEVGPYVLFTKDPVKMPADLGGEKFRSGQTQSNVDFFASHGINGVPLGISDTAPAIKTGGVVGAEYTPLFGVAIGTHKLAPNILASYHAHTGGTMSISKKVWDGLNEAQQSALREASSSFGELRAGVRGAHGFMLKKAAGEGAVVTEMTPEMRAAWSATAAEVQANMLSSIGGRADEFWAAIQAGKTSCDG